MYCGRGCVLFRIPRDATISRTQRSFRFTHARLAIRLPSFFDWSSCPAHPVYLYSLLSTVTLQCVDCNTTSSRLLQAPSSRSDYKSLAAGYFSSLHGDSLPSLPSLQYALYPTINTGKLPPGVSFHHTCICRWCHWYQDIRWWPPTARDQDITATLQPSDTVRLFLLSPSLLPLARIFSEAEDIYTSLLLYKYHLS
ncbi:hypothetical protein E2C01_054467 [Portunus trituberculatus]|uniref:Uncharacterized protein n=1 Tax=Portunus trituberculatus TaxID=210409 RepID=A0A5B7GS53_PORTR|nr:hypothetical protein [Portunus trituberculatus]